MKKPMSVCDLPHDVDTLATDSYDFKLNGSHHKGDICEGHKEELTGLLGTLVPMRQAAKAQRARKATTRTTTRTRKATRKTTAKRTRRASDHQVRAWAVENGVEVNSHGRVPNAIREQYLAAR